MNPTAMKNSAAKTAKHRKGRPTGAEKEETMNTMLNEKELTAVSGGAGTGKIGPNDPTVKAVVGKLESAKLALSHFTLADHKLEELLDKTINALKKGTGFNPWTALIYLETAYPMAQQLFQRAKTLDEKERAYQIGRFVGEAHSQLNNLLD